MQIMPCRFAAAGPDESNSTSGNRRSRRQDALRGSSREASETVDSPWVRETHRADHCRDSRHETERLLLHTCDVSAYRGPPDPPDLEQTSCPTGTKRTWPFFVKKGQVLFSLPHFRAVRICRKERPLSSSRVRPVSAPSSAVSAPELMPRTKKFNSACPVAASSNTSPTIVAREAFSTNARRRAVAAGRADWKNA